MYNIGILPCPSTGIRKFTNCILSLYPDAKIVSIIAIDHDVESVKKLIADNDLKMLFVGENLGIDINEINQEKLLVFPIHKTHLFAKRSEWYRENGMPKYRKKSIASEQSTKK